MDQQMQTITAFRESQAKTFKLVIAIIALTFFTGGDCFSQSDKTGQLIDTSLNQVERITILKKRIAEAGDDFVSLTTEEYDLLLSQHIGKIDGFEPLTTTAGGIMLGIGYAEDSKIYKTNIQTAFPNLPNISEGEVFVFFDLVKGSNGLDFLDRWSNTEIKEHDKYAEDDFTQLTLDLRTANSTSYWFGSRYVNLRDPSDKITVRAFGALGGEVALSAISGKIVMQLPTNISGLTLTKADIGIEKPFAGGVIALKEIKDDVISFQYTGDSKKIYSWTVYDDTNKILDIKDALSNNGLFQLYTNHPQSVKVYQAEIVRKEYPFNIDIH